MRPISNAIASLVFRAIPAILACNAVLAAFMFYRSYLDHRVAFLVETIVGLVAIATYFVVRPRRRA